MNESGFFDTKEIDGVYDREYAAIDFARYFRRFISNGVFAGISSSLQVVQLDEAIMAVKVMPGASFINGYWHEPSAEKILSVDIADGILNRKDIVVDRYDNEGRLVETILKKGEFAIDPSIPELVRTVDYYELGLAVINVQAGTVSITNEMITDLRLDSSYCGIVHGLIDQIDTTTLFLQLQSQVENNIELIQRAIDETEAGYLQAQIDKANNIEQVTILVNDWSAEPNSLGYYTATKTIEGVSVSDYPLLDVNTQGKTAEQINEVKSIAGGIIGETTINTIIFKIEEKPEIALDLILKGV